MPDGTAVATRFDPRTIIALAALAAAVVMMPGGLPFAVPVLLLGIGLAAVEGAWLRACGIVVSVAALWILGWMLPLWWPNTFTAITASAAMYTVRFVAMVSIGMHLVATVSPTRLCAALRAARVPRAVNVTLAVMVRFFPVVAAETVAVVDAMRLRGLTGVRGMLRHPILSMERFAVPLIASSLRAAEDLSASAILRGLGSAHRPTAMDPPRFGIADLLLALVVATLSAATVVLMRVLT